ncbi:unnamed protein product [Microthlaspi erraticum]|uniref:Bet v I/Major latex protein domain-containing protein n=1 Tax=Microthlaspi erraticum TaxID=1685480 RepID=A0A6D2J7Y6_9BRAS|nr:unnamed protein product [Microthlaspi erraticum]
MTLNGVLSTVIDVKSPADEFFKSIVQGALRIPGKDDLDTESIHWVKRIITVKFNRDEISESFKTPRGTVTVTPKEEGDGSHVMCTVKFEKINEYIEVPQYLLDAAHKIFTEMDDDLLH